MENKDALTGQTVRLPSGEPVRIEEVFEDGYAAVRRVGGALQGTTAVCTVAKLEPFDSASDIQKNEP